MLSCEWRLRVIASNKINPNDSAIMIAVWFVRMKFPMAFIPDTPSFENILYDILSKISRQFFSSRIKKAPDRSFNDPSGVFFCSDSILNLKPKFDL